MSTGLLPSRNLTLHGSYVGTLAEMRDLLDLQQSRSILAPPIAPLPMSEINDALDELARGAVRGRTVLLP